MWLESSEGRIGSVYDAGLMSWFARVCDLQWPVGGCFWFGFTCLKYSGITELQQDLRWVKEIWTDMQPRCCCWWGAAGPLSCGFPFITLGVHLLVSTAALWSLSIISFLFSSTLLIPLRGHCGYEKGIRGKFPSSFVGSRMCHRKLCHLFRCHIDIVLFC